MATYIELANGKYLEVPEGMTPQEALAARTRASVERASLAEPEFKTEVGEGMTGFKEGIGAGLSRVGRAAYNFGATPFRNDQEREAATQESRNIAELEAPLRATGRGAAGAFIGETAATLPIGGAASLGLKVAGRAAMGGHTAAQLLGAGKALPFAARVARSPYWRGALEGAAVGGITSEPGERGMGAAFGGGFGAAGAGAGQLLKRALKGSVPSLAARRLERQGVDLPAGMRATRLPGGGARPVAIAEQAATSIPILGSAPAAARENAEAQFAKLFAQKAAPPGVKPNFTGNARTDLKRLTDAFDTAYSKALNYPVYPKILRTAGGDVPVAGLIDDLQRTGIDVKDFSDPKLLKRFANPQRVIDARDIQQFRSQVRRQLGRLRRFDQSQPENRNQLRALRSFEAQLTDVLESQGPPAKLKALAKVDEAYRNFSTFEDAVEKAVQQLPKQGGTLSTAQIMRGVVAAASERGDKRSLSRGAAPMQDLAEQGLAVFGQDVPQTGTATRWGGAALGLPLSVAYSAGLSKPIARGFMPNKPGASLARSIRRSQFREEPERAARMLLQEYMDKEEQ